MGFEIDWEFLGKSLASVGDRTSQMLMDEYERKKREQENVRNMAREHQYRTLEFEEQETIRKKNDIDITKEKMTLEDEQFKNREKYKAGVDTFMGSADMAQRMAADVGSMDPLRVGRAMGMMKSLNKLRANEKLTAEDDIMLAQIDDQTVQAGIAGLKANQQKFNAELASSQAYASYMNSMATANKLRGNQQFTDNDLRQIDNDILSNQAAQQNLLQNETFRMVSSQVDKIRAKAGDVPPQALDQLLRQELGETHFTIYQNGLMNLQNLQKSTAYLEQMKQAIQGATGFMKPGAGKIAGGAMAGGAPPGVVLETAEKPDNPIIKYIKKSIGGFKEGVSKTIDKATHKHKLPANAKVYTEDELAEKKQSGFSDEDVKNGYVESDGKLYKITRVKKSIRFYEVKNENEE